MLAGPVTGRWTVRARPLHRPSTIGREASHMTSLLDRPLISRSTAFEERPLRVAVIGYGYWGPNLARNVALEATTDLAAIADLSPRRLAAASAAHPTAWVTADIAE